MSVRRYSWNTWKRERLKRRRRKRIATRNDDRGTIHVVHGHGDKSVSSPAVDYFGMGRMMSAFSAKVASPDLPFMRYWIFSFFTLPGTGSPPKLAL